MPTRLLQTDRTSYILLPQGNAYRRAGGIAVAASL